MKRTAFHDQTACAQTKNVFTKIYNLAAQAGDLSEAALDMYIMQLYFLKIRNYTTVVPVT